MRICVVDDHEVVREGLRGALEKDPLIRVVGEAGSGAEALEMVSRTHPEIVVTDYRLPDTTGDVLCRGIRAEHPEVKVIVLTTFLSEELVRGCLDAGASAFVTKASGLSELRSALSRVGGGDDGQPESVSSIVHRLHGSTSSKGALTPRQENVLALAAEGLTYGQIAAKLSISQSTVRFHIQGLKERLGAKSKTDLIAIAIRSALISPARSESW